MKTETRYMVCLHRARARGFPTKRCLFNMNSAVQFITAICISSSRVGQEVNCDICVCAFACVLDVAGFGLQHLGPGVIPSWFQPAFMP